MHLENTPTDEGRLLTHATLFGFEYAASRAARVEMRPI